MPVSVGKYQRLLGEQYCIVCTDRIHVDPATGNERGGPAALGVCLTYIALVPVCLCACVYIVCVCVCGHRREQGGGLLVFDDDGVEEGDHRGTTEGRRRKVVAWPHRKVIQPSHL